jgi:hypothetical protein
MYKAHVNLGMCGFQFLGKRNCYLTATINVKNFIYSIVTVIHGFKGNVTSFPKYQIRAIKLALYVETTGNDSFE